MQSQDMEKWFKQNGFNAHVSINARREADVNEKEIHSKLTKAIGSSYDSAQGNKSKFQGASEGVANVQEGKQKATQEKAFVKDEFKLDTNSREEFWQKTSQEQERLKREEEKRQESEKKQNQAGLQQRDKFWQKNQAQATQESKTVDQNTLQQLTQQRDQFWDKQGTQQVENQPQTRKIEVSGNASGLKGKFENLAKEPPQNAPAKKFAKKGPGKFGGVKKSPAPKNVPPPQEETVQAPPVVSRSVPPPVVVEQPPPPPVVSKPPPPIAFQAPPVVPRSVPPPVVVVEEPVAESEGGYDEGGYSEGGYGESEGGYQAEAEAESGYSEGEYQAEAEGGYSEAEGGYGESEGGYQAEAEAESGYSEGEGEGGYSEAEGGYESGNNQCRAIADWPGENEGDLTFAVGDIIDILDDQSDPEGWWQGTANGVTGYFPSNYCERV